MTIESATVNPVASNTRVVELNCDKWDRQKPVYEAARNVDVATWLGRATLEKYEGDFTSEQISAGVATPYERVIGTPQLLVYGGASALWHRLTGGTTVAAFDSTNAHIGVGDSSTAEAVGQTDLSASSNKLRKVVDATYPQHTDGVVVGAASVVFRATFGTSEANFAWNEWGIFNASTSGRMLNRKVEALGTKASGSTWVLTLTLSLQGS